MLCATHLLVSLVKSVVESSDTTVSDAQYNFNVLQLKYVHFLQLCTCNYRCKDIFFTMIQYVSLSIVPV